MFEVIAKDDLPDKGIMKFNHYTVYHVDVDPVSGRTTFLIYVNSRWQWVSTNIFLPTLQEG